MNDSVHVNLPASLIRPSRRRLVQLSIALSGLSLTACAAPPATPAPTPAAPSAGKPATAPTAAAKPAAAPTPAAAPAKPLASHVTVASASIADQLDPRWSLGQSGFAAARQVFDALVIFDRDSKLVPQLAHEWKRIDATTVEFKLRDDVKFSNGEDFTADAVKFSLENLLGATDAGAVTTKERMGGITAAEVVNSTTVRIKTKEPDPIIVNRLVSLLMVPPKYVADGGDMNARPIGTGSFKPTSFTRSRAIEYEAWDGTWRGKPTVRTARISMIPEAATMVAALRTGEADIIYNPPGDQAARLKTEGFNLATVNANSCTLATLTPTNPLMQDKRVREAVNLAVDRDELLKTVGGGFGKVATQLLQPGMFGYNTGLKPYPYDPERAKTLLSQAGAQGQEVRIMTTASTRPYFAAVAGYLNAVGLRTEIDLVEFAILLSNMSRGTQHAMLGFNIEYTPTLDFDTAGVRFSTVAAQPLFDNAEFHKLYLDSRKEVDEPKRQTMIQRMAQLMYDEFAALFLVWRDTPTMFTKKIADVHQRWDTSFQLWKIEKQA